MKLYKRTTVILIIVFISLNDIFKFIDTKRDKNSKFTSIF